MKRTVLKTLLSVGLVLTLTTAGCEWLPTPSDAYLQNTGSNNNNGNDSGNQGGVSTSSDWGIDQFNIGGNGSNGGSGSAGADDGTNVAVSDYEYIPLITDWDWEGEYEDNYSVSYSTEVVKTDPLVSYQNLYSSLKDVNGEIKRAAQDTYRDYTDFAKENLQYMNEDDYLSCYYYSNLSLYRSDNVMVSFVETIESYAGGAHPNTYYVSHNVDSQSGKVLSIGDVVVDKKAFKTEVLNALQRDFSNDGIGLDDLWDNYEEIINDSITDPEYGTTFVMDYDGITMIYSPYELAAYAFGPVFIKVYYEDCPNVFDNKYTYWPMENKVINNYDGMNLYMDYDDDGVDENVMVNFLYNDEYNEYENLIIETDTAKFQEEDMYAFDYTVTGAKVEGKYFVIVKTSVENDYSDTYIFSIENGKIRQTDELFGGFDSFTNPDYFLTWKRLDLMSTYDGYKLARLEADGTIKYLENCYTVSSHFDLKALQDVEGYKVDYIGAPDGEATTIAKGTQVNIAGTDDDTYVDLLLPDGSLVRVYVDNDDWPQTINGVDIYELFDGIMFAG